MKKLTTEERLLLDLLANSFLPTGGVSPIGNSRAALLNAFERQQVEVTQAGVKIIEALQSLIQSASTVGLTLTVNDLKRAVECLVEIWQANQQVKAGNQLPLLPPIYKGVSYNPETASRRERNEWLVILDFFALMRQIINDQPKNQQPVQFAIMDAGLYWVVNLLGEAGFDLVEPDPDKAAEKVVATILEACQQQQFEQVIKTNQVRNAYLQAVARQFPANYMPPVFSLKDVWLDSEFSYFLSQALQTFCQFRGRRWSVQNPVKYERYMAYSPWVTPLVAAEQALLAKKCSFRANLAPTSEAAWNKILDRICGKLRLPKYIIWMYVRRLGIDLPYGSIPAFSDSSPIISSKLSQPPARRSQLSELIIRLVAPFMGLDWLNESIKKLVTQEYEQLGWMINSFTQQVEQNVEETMAGGGEIPNLPLNNMGWLMKFPAGIC